MARIYILLKVDVFFFIIYCTLEETGRDRLSKSFNPLGIYQTLLFLFIYLNSNLEFILIFIHGSNILEYFYSIFLIDNKA